MLLQHQTELDRFDIFEQTYNYVRKDFKSFTIPLSLKQQIQVQAI